MVAIREAPGIWTGTARHSYAGLVVAPRIYEVYSNADYSIRGGGLSQFIQRWDRRVYMTG